MNNAALIILVSAAGVTVAKVLPALIPIDSDRGVVAALMRYLPAAILGAVTATGVANITTGSRPPVALYVAFVIVAAIAATTRRTSVALGGGLVLVVGVYATHLA